MSGNPATSVMKRERTVPGGTAPPEDRKARHTSIGCWLLVYTLQAKEAPGEKFAEQYQFLPWRNQIRHIVHEKQDGDHRHQGCGDYAQRDHGRRYAVVVEDEFECDQKCDHAVRHRVSSDLSHKSGT